MPVESMKVTPAKSRTRGRPPSRNRSMHSRSSSTAARSTSPRTVTTACPSTSTPRTSILGRASDSTTKPSPDSITTGNQRVERCEMAGGSTHQHCADTLRRVQPWRWATAADGHHGVRRSPGPVVRWRGTCLSWPFVLDPSGLATRSCHEARSHAVAESPLTASLAALSRFFVGDGNLEETLERVTRLTVEAVPAAALCGITMPVERRQRTAVFTDETAPEIDQAQYDSGGGPCLQAFDTQRVVEIASTTEPGPWPEFRRAAADHGIHSTLSLPLVVDKAPVGALNLYSSRPRGFAGADRETATLFASQAAIVLANAQAYWDAWDMSAGLSEAMTHPRRHRAG